MTDPEKLTEAEMIEREEHCEVYDAHNDFTRALNRELGPNAEAVITRLWDKYRAPHQKDRSFKVRKWERITNNAKERLLEISPVEQP